MGRERPRSVGSREGDARYRWRGGGGREAKRNTVARRRHHHLSSVSKTKFVPTRLLHATFFIVSTPSFRFSFPRSSSKEEEEGRKGGVQ